MSQSKHTATLKRRLEFLEGKLAANATSVNAAAYLKAEISALQWVLNIVSVLEAGKRLQGEVKTK